MNIFKTSFIFGSGLITGALITKMIVAKKSKENDGILHINNNTLYVELNHDIPTTSKKDVVKFKVNKF